MTYGNAPAAVPRSTLVVTAHAGDFVWRAGNAIALAASRGEKVTVACLTFGERGESAKAWREGRKPAEKHQPEMSGFRPEVLLDITEVWETKRRAMECLAAQQHLWDYHTDLAVRRGAQLQRNAGPDLGPAHRTMAEAYMRPYPQIAKELA